MRDSLGDFLDLSPDIESPQPQQVAHTIPPVGDVSRFLAGDESPVEGAIAGPSGGRNPKRFGGDWADPVLAEPSTSTRQVPRKVQSAGELASGRAVHARTVALDRGTPKPGTTDGDLQRSDSYGRRLPTQVPSTRAGVIRGDSRRGYDASAGPGARYEGGHAHSRSAVEPSDLWQGFYNKRVQDLRNGDIQNLKRGGLVAADPNSVRESPSREMGPVVQRNRVEVVGPVSSTLRRPRASSAATSPTPPLSPPRHENRYHRTLGDRAYHHPDVPRTPQFSEHDQDPSSWGPGSIVTQTRGRFTTTRLDSDTDDRLISSPETESTFPSPQSENSVSPGPRQPRPRRRAPSGDQPHPPRESSAPTHARRHGSVSSPDLPRGQSLFVGPPSASSLGIGLSTVDNGAFEAPRPAPPMPTPPSPPRTREQNHHPPVAWRRKNSLRIRTGSSADEGGSEKSSSSSSPVAVFRSPLRSLSLRSKPNNGSNGVAVAREAAGAGADPRVVRTASPVLGFGGMSFRWQIWSKVQRSPTERSDTPAPVGRLRAAGKSEPDIKTSFIDTEAKPQRKGLLFKKRS